MALLVDALFAVGALSGAVMVWLGVYCYRRWNEPGVVPFAAVAVCLGASGLVSIGIAVSQGMPIPENGPPAWANDALSGWALAMVPWIVFALQYTGRYTRFRVRTVAAIAFPVLGILTLLVLQRIGFAGESVLTQIVGTLSLLYVFALVIVGSYLLLRTTYEYGHLSLAQGATLALAGITPLVAVNFLGTLAVAASDTVVYAVFVLAFLIPAVSLLLSVFHYRVFDSTPAAGALGERAIPRETDDLVFVVDRDGRIIKTNETAASTLGVSRTDSLGEPFSSVLSRDVAELAAAETVALETTVGTRQFDPQVTAFTDQHDRQLGTLLSLRDVTDRELRKQRLKVFNRVLRHNLRNRVDVIKSNAEAVTGDENTEFTDSITDAADELAALSERARSTDQLLSRPPQDSSADLPAVIRDLIDGNADVDLTLDIPESAALTTDWAALRAALESSIENAIEYAESSVTVSVRRRPESYVVVVSDDGPGIPESELGPIDDGTETQFRHGTGLGLWRLRWGITRLNGDLDVDTTDGTTVRMTIPARSARPASV